MPALGQASQVAATLPAGIEPAAAQQATVQRAEPGLTLTPVAEPLDPEAPFPSQEDLAELQAATLPAELIGTSLGVHVRDVLTGAELYASAAQPHIPASTLKILTAASAIVQLGASSSLSTTVVALRTGPTTAALTLVGGGDVLLAPDAGNPDAVMGHAGLGDLAREAALTLRGQGITEVTVALDDSLFTGPTVLTDWAWSPTTTWGSPIYPIEIYSGRSGEAFDGETYLEDPALAAAQQFQAKLVEAGQDTSLALPALTVTGEVTRSPAPAGAHEVARVESAPLRELLAWQLQMSDNVLSESLGRVAAVAAGQAGSFEGCAEGIRITLEALGVDPAGAHPVDCSGLSHDSVVSPATLTELLVLAQNGTLGPIQRGLAVAGLEGTMSGRLLEYPAAGNARAKTGSLTGVNSLAGVVQTASGRQIAFAVMADGSAAIWTDTVRAALDAYVAGLAAM
ncbi:MAG: D-alanyl-D-alanine carboxypeptidase/D-alanyl-D-alanine-endopeptidase [Bifidobacteriaceae bacterium]|jgi:D-alanyl-D-alanine carboxypeptidase/D-alanyl-D-alanine-endopeptidase (penicillin-binding protein 4)|nr:D-alanyl-D-alanine carboxypeptidase/D-alanyl-D-alanine-endopeptidase [Bifidobacteriaceae bacterium]